MNVAHLLYPVEVLGPGKRLGIWLSGCERRCVGCSNPELWHPLPEHRTTVPSVLAMIQSIAGEHRIDGVTITGGEPFLQAEELDELLQAMRSLCTDILIYSGYRLEELRLQATTGILSILSSIAVLVDGVYIEERNTGAILCGSDNQRVHILNPSYRELYEDYLRQEKNRIQNFSTRDGIISVGIHEPGFREDFEQRLPQHGLIKKGKGRGNDE